MTWARENFERVALIAGILFLFLCAFFIWRSAGGFAANFASLQPAGPQKPPAPIAKAADLEDAMRKVGQVPQWTFAGRSGIFVPEKHFIGPNGMPATLQTTEVHPPVPNEWLDQFSLPIADADVLTQDPDKDGYANLEEWQQKTNPTDKNSHPPFIAKLKLKAFTREPFRLVFASRTGDTFGINTSDLKDPTQFLQLGDGIRGTKFRIVDFKEKSAPNQYGTEMDVSELTLENQDNRERFNLVKEKIMISPESVATFVYLWGDRREFQVKRDREFSLPPQTEISYKLLDVQSDKAVIVNTLKPDERIEVGPLAP
ncbi:MAG: hypothetical protein H0U88_00700 [Chthoniobacterales bacterium]|nr:hypothetical protein [Chthoniobacterales bacterium]